MMKELKLLLYQCTVDLIYLTHQTNLYEMTKIKTLEKYKNISEERPTKVNTLLELYEIIQTIEIKIDQLKTNN